MAPLSIPARTAIGLVPTVRGDVNDEKSAFGVIIGLRMGRIRPPLE